MNLETHDNTDINHKVYRKGRKGKSTKKDPSQYNNINTEIVTTSYKDVLSRYMNDGADRILDEIDIENNYAERYQLLQGVSQHSPNVVMNMYNQMDNDSAIKDVIQINCRGYERSRRGKDDGYVFFGVEDDKNAAYVQ